MAVSETYPASPTAEPNSKGLALVDVEWKFGDTIFPFILNNDRTGLVIDAIGPAEPLSGAATP